MWMTQLTRGRTPSNLSPLELISTPCICIMLNKAWPPSFYITVPSLNALNKLNDYDGTVKKNLNVGHLLTIMI